MSTFVAATVTCPHCGHAHERQVATSVNAVRSPWLREAILDDSFQREPCEACDHEMVLVVPFLYVDFDRDILIGVYPLSHGGDWASLEREALVAFTTNVVESTSGFARRLSADVRVRTAFGLDALREKIMILEAGLDDAAIEAVKLQLLATRDDLCRDPDSPLLFLEMGSHDLRFAAELDDGSGRRRDTVRVGRHVYDAIAAGSAPEIVAALRAGPYCDRNRLLGSTP